MLSRIAIKYLCNFGYPCCPEVTQNIYVISDIRVFPEVTQNTYVISDIHVVPNSHKIFM